jgi:hypothetical protein
MHTHPNRFFCTAYFHADAWVDVAWQEIHAQRFFTAESIEALYLKPGHIQEKKPV